MGVFRRSYLYLSAPVSEFPFPVKWVLMVGIQKDCLIQESGVARAEVGDVRECVGKSCVFRLKEKLQRFRATLRAELARGGLQ